MNIKRVIFFVIIICIISLASGFIITRNVIKNQLTLICTQATEKYKCQTRKALILQLNDNTVTVKQKNSTIWALGKMKVKEALPDLERLNSEYAEPGHKYHNSLNELKKAVGYLKYGKTDLISFQDFDLQ
jgi:hypothetical protein